MNKAYAEKRFALFQLIYVQYVVLIYSLTYKWSIKK